MEMSETTEVQLGRLDERLKALDRKFDANNLILLKSIEDLKDNYAGRLAALELSKFPSVDFVQWRTNEFVPLEAKVNETNKLASDTFNSYGTDKARIWVAIAVLVALGGTIITLSIMAINSKIKTGITDALDQYEVQINEQTNTN